MISWERNITIVGHSVFQTSILFSFAKGLGKLSDFPGLLEQVFVVGRDKSGEPRDFGAGGFAGGQKAFRAQLGKCELGDPANGLERAAQDSPRNLSLHPRGSQGGITLNEKHFRRVMKGDSAGNFGEALPNLRVDAQLPNILVPPDVAKLLVELGRCGEAGGVAIFAGKVQGGVS